MKLSAKALNNVDSVNAFQFVSSMETFSNQPNDLYFQIVDLHRDGIRYIPQAGSILTVTFENIDSAQNIVKTASNPFANDLSIFKVSLSSSESVSSGGLQFKLTENSVDKPFYVPMILTANPSSVGGC